MDAGGNAAQRWSRNSAGFLFAVEHNRARVALAAAFHGHALSDRVPDAGARAGAAGRRSRASRPPKSPFSSSAAPPLTAALLTKLREAGDVGAFDLLRGILVDADATAIGVGRCRNVPNTSGHAERWGRRPRRAPAMGSRARLRWRRAGSRGGAAPGLPLPPLPFVPAPFPLPPPGLPLPAPVTVAGVAFGPAPLLLPDDAMLPVDSRWCRLRGPALRGVVPPGARVQVCCRPKVGDESRRRDGRSTNGLASKMARSMKPPRSECQHTETHQAA